MLGPDHQVRSTSTTGRAVDVLEQRSRTAKLLVVGAGHLDHGGHHLLRHSVARDIARHASCPVAIVRDHANRPDDPVVVGIDDSATSWRALQWAVDDCATTGRPLVAVHAWHIDGRTLDIVISDDEAARIERCAGQVLDEAIASLRHGPGGVDIEMRTAYGTASGVVLDAVPDPAMVVVGTRQLGAAGRLFLGSSADMVARHAHTTVVIVPPPPPS